MTAAAAVVHHFKCPECSLTCRYSEKQRAVQHEEPTCKTWRAHQKDMAEFLRLALMAARGNLILGTAGAADVVSQPTDEKAKNEILEQLYEGLKKL